MDLWQLSLSKSAFWQILLAGVVLFAAFRFIPKVIRMLRVRPQLRIYLTRALPVSEFLLWMLFIVWVLGKIAGNAQSLLPLLLTLSLAGLVIWAAWFAIRDVVAGVILKAEDIYETGQQIKLKSLEGRIVKSGYRSLMIETTSGEVVKIPYSRIAGQQRVLSNPAEIARSHSFSLKVPKTTPLPEAIERVRICALNAPWTSITREPQVKPGPETADYYHIDVVVYAPGEHYFQKIEALLRNEFGEQASINA
ncbi:MAG: mechanosensitive ion channel family protein [Calditrichae bacterium]|nr:mechanosensitive ion channel family protein [Calditrichia bacterium]